MSELNINNADSSNYSSVLTDYSITSKIPDDTTGEKETRWQNTKWAQQWGYFLSNGDLRTAILLKAVWIVGKGYETNDSRTKVILDHIRGIGKDHFLSIIFNMEVIKRIGGDAYAEIMRKDDTIINLKVIDPSSMTIVTDTKGVIIRYEQNGKKGVKSWTPEQILHLSHNRLSWECHGNSDVDAVEKTILADEESFDDNMKLNHRQARPMILWKLKTDNNTKIQSFISKIDQARKYGEDMFIPDDDGIATYEVLQVSPSAFLLEWRNEVRNRFYRTIGLPQIVPGAAGQSSESEGKTIYFAFEQLCAKDRIFLEQDIWNQLYLKVKFVPPSTMQADISADEAADGNGQILAQPSDLDVRSGR